MFDEDLRSQVAADHARQAEKLRRFTQAQDPLTVELNRLADRSPERYPEEYFAPGTSPHSGKIGRSNTMRYTSGEVHIERFEAGDPNVYARNGNVYTTQLGPILGALDKKVAQVRITNWGMSAFNVVVQTIGSLRTQMEMNERASGKKSVIFRQYARKLCDAFRLIAGQDLRPHVVACVDSFGGCKVLLNRFTNVTFVTGESPEEWERAVRKNTVAFFIETPGNPTMKKIDIPAVAKIARANGRKIIVVADGSLDPFGAPLEKGAHINAFSLTKYFGNEEYNGGALTMSQDFIELYRDLVKLPKGSDVNWFLDHVAYMGATHGPGDVVKELIENARHLPGRFKQQVETTVQIARLFEKEGITVNKSWRDNENPQEKGVPVLSVDLKSKDAALEFIEILEAYGFPPINNFGGPITGTTLCHFTTHHSLTSDQLAEQGIGEGLIRLSIGIEDTGLAVKVFKAALDELKARPSFRPEIVHPALAA